MAFFDLFIKSFCIPSEPCERVDRLGAISGVFLLVKIMVIVVNRFLIARVVKLDLRSMYYLNLQRALVLDKGPLSKSGVSKANTLTLIIIIVLAFTTY